MIGQKFGEILKKCWKRFGEFTFTAIIPLRDTELIMLESGRRKLNNIVAKINYEYMLLQKLIANEKLALAIVWRSRLFYAPVEKRVW